MSGGENKINWGDTKGMILAAGFGTRLRPLTETVPKPLAPVAGVNMVRYALGLFRGAGLSEVWINTHHLAESIESELGDGSNIGMRLRYSREQEILGAGGGVARAMRYFGHSRLVLINADTLINADLAELTRAHHHGSGIATMAVVKAPDPENYTKILVMKKRRVLSIGGRPETWIEKDDAPLEHYTYTGLAVIEPELLKFLPRKGFGHLAADGLIPAMYEGHKVAAHVHQGYWKALDDAERIEAAEADIAAGVADLPAPAIGGCE